MNVKEPLDCAEVEDASTLQAHFIVNVHWAMNWLKMALVAKILMNAQKQGCIEYIYLGFILTD